MCGPEPGVQSKDRIELRNQIIRKGKQLFIARERHINSPQTIVVKTLLHGMARASSRGPASQI
jgi:uncharacterized lipoprotein YbaY